MRIVLIGGQALNYWCERYEQSVDLGDWLPTSKDVDFQGTAHDAEIVAQKLGGELVLASMDDVCGHIAIVKAPTNEGKVVNLDFLVSPYGLVNPAKVLDGAKAVPLEGPSGKTVTVHVMHPVHCLASRVHNVMGLPHQYDNAHGLGQLRAAIGCARASIVEQLSEKQVRPALDAAKVVFRLAKHDRSVELMRSKAIHISDAVPLDDRWPRKFVELEHPRQMRKIAEKLAKRNRLLAQNRRSEPHGPQDKTSP